MIEFEYDKTGVGMRMELLRSKAKSTREKVAEDLDISKDSLYAYEKRKEYHECRRSRQRFAFYTILQWNT